MANKDDYWEKTFLVQEQKGGQEQKWDVNWLKE